MTLLPLITITNKQSTPDRGIHRLYEGDPAPSSPFAELLNIETGEPLGHSGMSRLVPWEGGSKTAPPNDYLVVITDPRPKSIELRSAVKRLCNGGSGLGVEVLKRTVVINSDTPGENRKFLKKNFAENSVGVEALTVLVDENLEWMREYTALGEKVSLCLVDVFQLRSLCCWLLVYVLTVGTHTHTKTLHTALIQRFSMTMFVLSEGKCQKIARDIDEFVVCNAIKNAVKSVIN